MNTTWEETRLGSACNITVPRFLSIDSTKPWTSWPFFKLGRIPDGHNKLSLYEKLFSINTLPKTLWNNFPFKKPTPVMPGEHECSIPY